MQKQSKPVSACVGLFVCSVVVNEQRANLFALGANCSLWHSHAAAVVVVAFAIYNTTTTNTTNAGLLLQKKEAEQKIKIQLLMMNRIVHKFRMYDVSTLSTI